MSQPTFAQKLAAVAGLNLSPQNMAPPPGAARIEVRPQRESPGNVAALINRTFPGDPNSPMDHVVIRKATPPDALDGVKWPSVEQVRAIEAYLRDMDYEPPKDVVKALAAEDPAYLRLQEAIAEASRAQHPKYLAHLEDIAARVASGDASASKEDAWSRDEWNEDARLRIGAFKTELAKLTTRCWAIAEPALLEKAEFANAVADHLEIKAKAPFDQLGVPYSPPLYVLVFRKYALTLSNGSRRNAGLPSAMLETL